MVYPSWLLLSDRGGVEYKLGVDKQPDLGFKPQIFRAGG